MQILFCDQCNESIPQTDLEKGVAGFEDGKVLCHMHFEPSLAAPVVPGGGEATGGGGALRFFSILILLGLAGLMGFLGRGLADGDPRGDDQAQEPPESPESRFLRTLGQRVEVLEQAVDRASSAREQSLVEVSRRLDSVGEAVLSLEAVIARELQTDEQDQKLLLAAVQESSGLAGLTEDLGEMAERLDAIDRKMSGEPGRTGDEGAAPAGQAAPRAATAQPAGQDGRAAVAAGQKEKEEEEQPNPARDQWIRSLKSTDPGTRFTALVELTAIGGEKAAMAIAGLLKDEDPFLRSYSAHSLGRLQAWSTVPDLISALGDTDVSVRQAVYEALNQVTGKGFGFRADDNAADRQRSVRKWQEWWRDHPTARK